MFAGFKNLISQYAPNTRDVEIAVIPMERAEADGSKTDVGTAVPMLFDLAEVRGLKDQHIIDLMKHEWMLHAGQNVAGDDSTTIKKRIGEAEKQFFQLLVTDPNQIQALFNQIVVENAAKPDDARREIAHPALVNAARNVRMKDLVSNLYVITHPEPEKEKAKDDKEKEAEAAKENKAEVTIREKTPFELMFLPVVIQNEKKEQPDLVKSTLARENNYRMKRGLKLPFETSKITAHEERLAELLKNGLSIKEGGFCRHATLNVGNGAKHRPIWEDLLHYGNAWLALLATGFAVLSIGVYAPWAMVGLGISTYFIQRSGNNFGFFDLAENTLREIRALFSPEFNPIYRPTKERFLDAVSKIGFILAVSGVAAFSTYLAVMGVALPTAVVNGLPLVVKGFIPLIQTATAILLGGSALYGALINSLIPLRKERGLTINDNQIRATKDEINALPRATYHTSSLKTQRAANEMLHDLDHILQNGNDEVPAVELTQAQTLEFARKVLSDLDPAVVRKAAAEYAPRLSTTPRPTN